MRISWRWTHNRLPEIQAKLPKAAKSIAVEVAERVADDARKLVPVQTGNLRDSIRVEGTRTGAEVGTDVDYAPFVEYGTRGRPARPFLGPAVERHRRDAEELGASLEARL